MHAKVSIVKCKFFHFLDKILQFLFLHFTKNRWIAIFNSAFPKTISLFTFFNSTFHNFFGYSLAFFNFAFFSFTIFSSLKVNFIFTEMFKQQDKISIEIKFCFCIHKPVIVRNYKKKTTNKFA